MCRRDTAGLQINQQSLDTLASDLLQLGLVWPRCGRSVVFSSLNMGCYSTFVAISQIQSILEVATKDIPNHVRCGWPGFLLQLEGESPTSTVRGPQKARTARMQTIPVRRTAKPTKLGEPLPLRALG